MSLARLHSRSLGSPARVVLFAWLTSACTGWGTYRPAAPALAPTPAPGPFRVTLNNGSARLLNDLVVRPDSVIGIGTTVVIPTAFPRKDVLQMRHPSWAAYESMNIKLRDGSVHLLHKVKLTKDSVAGLAPGPSVRIAIARRDVQKVEHHGPQTGRTMGFIVAILAGTLIIGVAAMAGDSQAYGWGM